MPISFYKIRPLLIFLISYTTTVFFAHLTLVTLAFFLFDELILTSGPWRLQFRVNNALPPESQVPQRETNGLCSNVNSPKEAFPDYISYPTP